MLIFPREHCAQRSDIDTEVLSQIILEKQKELKKRLLSDIVVKNVETTNYATYNTLYYLINALVSEKNKTVMTQEIVNTVTRYVISHLAGKYILKKSLGYTNSPVIDYEVPEFSLIEKGSNDKQDYKNDLYEKKKSSPANARIIAQFYSLMIDTLYQSLSQVKELSDIGLFTKQLNSKFIGHGLTIDYKTLISKNPSYHNAMKSEIANLLRDVSAIDLGIDQGSEFKKFIEIVKKYNFSKYPQNNDPVSFNISRQDLGTILKRFLEIMEVYKEDIGEGTIVAKMAEIVTRYVIFDNNGDDESTGYKYRIDVEGIILALEDEFLSFSIVDIRQHAVGIKPFFTIGLNYLYFFDDQNEFTASDGTSESFKQLSLMSEKLGVKFILSDQKYTRSQKPNEWYAYRGSYYKWEGAPVKSIVNNIYGFVYVSGVLYNIVNVKSDSGFTMPLLAGGFGAEFFNSLELNLSYGMPINVNASKPFKSENGFVSLSFDIPIFEYIRALKNK